MKCRSKIVEITAHRIGDEGWPDEIWDGVNRNEIILHLGREGDKTVGCVEIKTLEGTMRGDVGDWIIKGTEGEFYPCKDSVFQRKYEAIE